jgi:Uma2 family endonuclease
VIRFGKLQAMARNARAQIAPKIDFAQYLADESQRADRHEYHDGYVYAMAAGTHEHSLMQARLIRNCTSERELRSAW